MGQFRYAIFVLLGISSVSCVPPSQVPSEVQLFDLKSPTCSTVDGFLNYENDSIQVAYVFWAEDGLAGVYVHNKLHQPLYVDWKRCSFITGTTKHDYWDATVTMTTNGSSNGVTETSSSYWKSFYGGLAGYSSSSSNTIWSSVTTMVKPERITFIPPGTTITRSFNWALQDTSVELDRSDILAQDTVFTNIPSHFVRYQKYKGTTYTYDSLGSGPLTVHMLCNKFGPENSPLSFRIFMTYSTSDKFVTDAFIDSQFYVDRITQIPISAFAAKADPSDSRNIWATPRSFYVIKTSADVSP